MDYTTWNVPHGMVVVRHSLLLLPADLSNAYSSSPIWNKPSVSIVFLYKHAVPIAREKQNQRGPKKGKTHLGSKVEAQPAGSLHCVLHQQWHFAGQANLDLCRQCRCLAEVDQVLERKGQRHGFAQLNLHVLLWLLHILVATQRHCAATNVALARELDSVLAGVDVD